MHDEAEVLEHAVSDLLVERLDARLGHPVRDPHGDPIPTADGHVPAPAARPLADVESGAWVVARISDADPDLLRYFDSLGLGVDAVVEVGARHPGEEEGVTVRVGGRSVPLEPRAAGAVWVAAPDGA